MTSTSNAIDLSKLPPPNIIEALSYESILAEMIAALVALMPDFDASLESDPAVRILQISAYRELLLRQRYNDEAKAVLLAYAQGSDLDALGANLLVARLLGELDDDFRGRIALGTSGFSVAGPRSAYEFHARSADSQIIDVAAKSPSPGEVVVSVLTNQGSGTASAGLLAIVAAALNADTVRPLTDHVTVQSASIVNYAIGAEIKTYTGPDVTIVMAEATAKLNAYVASERRIGRDITKNGIVSSLRVGGVHNVILTTPTGDIAIADTEAAHCTSITLTQSSVTE